jgi:hypothetical protein
LSTWVLPTGGSFGGFGLGFGLGRCLLVDFELDVRELECGGAWVLVDATVDEDFELPDPPQPAIVSAAIMAATAAGTRRRRTHPTIRYAITIGVGSGRCR